MSQCQDHHSGEVQPVIWLVSAIPTAPGGVKAGTVPIDLDFLDQVLMGQSKGEARALDSADVGGMGEKLARETGVGLGWG